MGLGFRVHGQLMLRGSEPGFQVLRTREKWSDSSSVSRSCVIGSQARVGFRIVVSSELSQGSLKFTYKPCGVRLPKGSAASIATLPMTLLVTFHEPSSTRTRVWGQRDPFGSSVPADNKQGIPRRRDGV